MFRLRLSRLVALPFVLAAMGCDEDSPAAPVAEQFASVLSGSNEVPPVSTTASGNATFTAIGDTAIAYTITVSGLSGVTMAHIHAAGAGVNGGVVAWLLPPNGTAPQAASGPVNGVLATGRITAAWIRGISGAAPISLDSLKALMRNGNAYVNIHTSTHGGGELRGQITAN